jgi:hypothetical protein
MDLYDELMAACLADLRQHLAGEHGIPSDVDDLSDLALEPYHEADHASTPSHSH